MTIVGPLRRLAWASLAVWLVAACASPCARAVEQKYWGVTPYRLRVEVAIDASWQPEPGLAERLAAELAERIDSAIGPLWKAEVVVAAGPRRATLLRGIPEFSWDDLSAEQRTLDKLLFVTLRANPSGWEIHCREFDVYLRRWGDALETRLQQRTRLDEAVFDTLVDAFSPLATVHTIEDDDAHVELLPRGYELPSRDGQTPFFAAGRPFEPILRRTDRAGELLENGVVPISWTYLSAIEPEDGAWLADVFTGVSRPFRARRRGQVEQLAIGLTPRGDSTVVRFYARQDKSIGLAGYEVFRKTGDEGTELIAVTDRDGEAVIGKFDEAIVTLYLRSDGQLLAKIPVAPGAIARLEAPIADDAARLRAQAELRTVREELIDLVARRAILMGRARSYLQAGRLDDAQKLMAELSELPGVAQFSREITMSERASESSDPGVQKRIETMFADTRSLLSKFLNPKPISDLQAEVSQARAAPN
ncbi:MAG: hypothetical protein KDA44_22515 [Planctomycetales bacterium]|nr:hypothetical protein [Planctomycetales bacterium]